MSVVSVREFAHNPSAMFARAENGETIDITRHGKVIATLVPSRQRTRTRVEELEACGALRRSGKTTDDLDAFTRIALPEGAPDPLHLLFEDRHREREWEKELRE